MNGFTYTLTLLEPVLANSLGGEPNSANSLFYIPGGLVRGAAINAFTGKKDAGDDDFRRLFLNGSVRFLNAYPVSENGRALPTPLQYKKPKYFEGGDLSTIKDKEIHALEEVWQINVHTQRDAEAGHAKEDAGAVYRYIALPAGLVLEGAVLAEDDKDKAKIKELFVEKGTILLGKARTAGYGTAKIEIKDLMLNEINENLDEKLSGFTLTLLSPAVVRDETGQPTLDISIALSARLGIEVKVEDNESSRRGDIVGGFNRTWGLPLPQVTAIAAGSVFKVTASVEGDKLIKLQETGIGERRAEGFGRVMVNQDLPDIKKDDTWPDPVAAKMAESEKSAGLSENPTAKLMVSRLARKDLDEKVIHTARQMTEEYKGNIPNSQLSRWRVVIRTAIDKKSIADLQKFLAESKGKTGWKKMEKARVKPGGTPQRLTEWMDEWLETPAKLQEVLKPQLDQRFSLGENSFKFNDELNLEYRLRLLDAVLAVMAKKNGGSND
jgi:CRISPR-associated protein Csx10